MADGEIDTSGMSPEEILELQKQNCIFCKIADKEIPAKIVHEDDDVICVLDINPASEGHILVYPKKHYMILPHVPKEISNKLFKTAKLMSQTVLRALQCKGTTIFIANGGAAGQKAPHMLIHVFSRKEGDGILQLPVKKIDDQELKKNQALLKAYITKILGPSQKKPEHKTDEKPKADSEDNLVKVEIEKPSGERIDSEAREAGDDIEEDNETEYDESPDADDTAESHKKPATKKDNGKKKKKSERKPERPQKSMPQQNSPSQSSGNKVDLNDIARLFGGR
jgi:histidine triad (HIT) family protein